MCVLCQSTSSCRRGSFSSFEVLAFPSDVEPLSHLLLCYRTRTKSSELLRVQKIKTGLLNIIQNAIQQKHRHQASIQLNFQDLKNNGHNIRQEWGSLQLPLTQHSLYFTFLHCFPVLCLCFMHVNITSWFQKPGFATWSTPIDTRILRHVNTAYDVVKIASSTCSWHKDKSEDIILPVWTILTSVFGTTTHINVPYVC